MQELSACAEKKEHYPIGSQTVSAYEQMIKIEKNTIEPGAKGWGLQSLC